MLGGRELAIVEHVIENSPIKLAELENWIMERYGIGQSAAYKAVYRLRKAGVLRFRRSGNTIFVEVTPQFVSLVTRLYAKLLEKQAHRVRYFERRG